MKIGLCTPTRNIEKVKAMGYDYIEVAGNEIAAMSDEEFDAKMVQLFGSHKQESIEAASPRWQEFTENDQIQS